MTASPHLRELCLQLTNACPMRCIHCSTRAGPRDPEELTTDDHIRLISDFATLGGEIVELSGGEPLIYTELDSLVQFASGLSLEVRLYSSGVVGFVSGFAVPPDLDRWRRLKASGLQKVFFNLQGDVPTVHERVSRLPGSFAAVVKSIEAAKSAGLFVGIHFVPMKSNYLRIEETVHLAATLGADEFAVLRFVSQGRGADNSRLLALNQEEFFRLLADASKLKKDTSAIDIRLGCPFNYRFLGDPTGPIPSCKAGDTVCHVRPNGDVVPCSGFQQAEAVLGNLRASSLEELWHDSPSWSRFSAMRTGGPIPGSVEFVERNGEACLAQISIANQRAGGNVMSTAIRQTDSRSPGEQGTGRIPVPDTSL